MPFVEVWVDEPECTGGCERSDDLIRRRDVAIERIFAGDANGAVDILTKPMPSPTRADIEPLRNLYEKWKAGEMEGFDGPKD